MNYPIYPKSSSRSSGVPRPTTTTTTTAATSAPPPQSSSPLAQSGAANHVTSESNALGRDGVYYASGSAIVPSRQPSSAATATTATAVRVVPGVAVSIGESGGSGNVIREGSPQPRQQQKQQHAMGAPVPSSSPATAARGASAASASSAAEMFPHPLGMQATVLRNPDWFEQSRVPELVEPGDILYDVLRAPQLSFEGEENFPATTTLSKQKAKKEKNTGTTPADGEVTGGNNEDVMAIRAPVMAAPTFGIQPSLALPDKVGAYMTRESFKALLCFQNSAPYVLSSLRFRVDVVTPRQQQLSILKEDLPSLAAKANYAFPIDIPLSVAGTFTLSVHVYYQDPSLTDRRLSWASSFPVEQTVTEVAQRVLQRVPLPQRRNALLFSSSTVEQAKDKEQDTQLTKNMYQTIFKSGRGSSSSAAARLLTLEDAVKDLRLPRCSYALTVGLRNTCSVPVMLSDVALRCNANGPIVVFDGEPKDGLLADDGGTSSAGVCGEECPPRHVLSAQGQHMQPGEQRQYTFRLLIDPAALSAGGGVGAGVGAGGGPLYLGPSLASGIGCLEWAWRRANGDGGRERSSVLTLGRIRGIPDVELLVLRVRPAAAAAVTAAADSSTTTATTAGVSCLPSTVVGAPRLRAGRPLEVDLCLVYSPQPQHQHARCVSGVQLTPGRTASGAVSPFPSSSAATGGVGKPEAFAGPIVTGTAVSPAAATRPSALDVALKVRPEKLAPNFLYSGPALRPLGLLEAHTPLPITLTLLPWQSGLLPLARDAVQIVEARAPDTVLWPPAPAAVSSSSAASEGARLVSTPSTGKSPNVDCGNNNNSNSNKNSKGSEKTMGNCTGSPLFAERVLVCPPTSADADAGAEDSVISGGNGTAPAVAAVPMQVVGDGEEQLRTAVLCEILVQ